MFLNAPAYRYTEKKKRKTNAECVTFSGIRNKRKKWEKNDNIKLMTEKNDNIKMITEKNDNIKIMITEKW